MIRLVSVIASGALAGAMAATVLNSPGEAQERRPSSQPASAKPSSFELIDQALKAAQIDEETAHKYRVFAGFGDTRLPARYRGGEPPLIEPPDAVAEAGARLETFSATTRAELEPFFKRPDEPGSWITLSTVRGRQESSPGPTPPASAKPPPGVGLGFGLWQRGDPSTLIATTTVAAESGQAPQWQSFSAAGGQAKVWAQTRYYPADSTKATALARALSTHIWSKLDNLMGPEPVSDAGFPNNGGDAALDFYLVRMVPSGVARASNPATPCAPSHYILINGALPVVGSSAGAGILATAAHELMHAIQFAYSTSVACYERWIREGTATWAENFVYPLENGEHRIADRYLMRSHSSVDGSYPDTYYSYGTYLLSYFQEMTGGGPGFMPKMWDNFKTMKALGGVDAVLSGGFDAAWPKFLVRNWNQLPVDNPNGYKGWDKLPYEAPVWLGVDQVSVPTGTRTVPIPFPQADPPWRQSAGLPSLAGLYKHFKFDKTVHWVAFTNTIGGNVVPQFTVWGIEKIHGAWKQPVDWTKTLDLDWCRDQPTQDLEELVIIFGNSDWKTRRYLNPVQPPEVRAYATGCSLFVGNITATHTLQSADFDLVATADARVRFEPDPDLVNPGYPKYWRAVSGVINWTANATGKCHGNASGTIPIKVFGGDDGNHMASVAIRDDGGQLLYSGSTGPLPDALAPKVTLTCPENTLEMPLAVATWWTTDPTGHAVSTDGKTLSGAFALPGLGPNQVLKWNWALHSVP